jgi:DNA-binding transcriptional LysR family regulator
VLSLANLQYFHTLARRGNFARAAEELRLSQPALSRSIQALERHLGVQLVERERGRSGILLTPAGVTLLKHADTVVGEIGRLEGLTGGTDSETLAFGIGPQFATLLLPGLVDGLMEQFPSVSTAITIGSTATMTETLLDGDLDFFVSGPLAGPRSPRIRCERFASVPLCFYVRDGHPLLGRKKVTAEQLNEYPRFSGTVFRDRLLAEDDETVALLHPTLCVDNFDMLIRMTLTSDAVMASFVGGMEPPLRRVPFDLAGLLGPSTTFVFRLDGIALPAAGRYAVKQLRAALRDRVDGQP